MNPNHQAKVLELLEVRVNADCEKPFIVPTPRPYLVDLSHAGPTEKEQGQAKMALLGRVNALYKVLQLLDIHMCTAYRKGYTLNRSTYDALRAEVDFGGRLDGAKLDEARALLAQLA